MIIDHELLEQTNPTVYITVLTVARLNKLRVLVPIKCLSSFYLRDGITVHIMLELNIFCFCFRFFIHMELDFIVVWPRKNHFNFLHK